MCVTIRKQIIGLEGSPMNNEELWSNIKASIESKIGENATNTWFKSSSIDLDHNNKLIIYLENQFASDWVRHNYSSLIRTTADELLNSNVEILITSKKD
jgi:chromosomal replication initiation ATPase DnaA